MIVALQTLVYFRETLFTHLNRWLQPYYNRFALVKSASSDDSDEEEDVHVYSEYDEDKGVVFFPPVYAQRYAAVSDCLLDERWRGKIEKVVDLGYNDISFIKYLKEVPGVKEILGVDLECIPMRCSSGLFMVEDYTPKRENPLRVTLFQGNAADPDFRLIGCDAVVAIEMIEHMLPHDLERLVHTVFGFIKPWVAVFTTPNADFNVLFKALESNGLRRLDHLFEWSREQFHDWCSNIVVRYPEYTVTCRGIGPGPPGTVHLGCCSQMAVFVFSDYQKQVELDPQSMAMVPSVPNADNLTLSSDWDNQSTISEKIMLCNTDSCPEMISEKTSSECFSSPSMLQLPAIECQDSTAQCNLDKENAKNFLMYDQDNENYQKETYQIVVPRREILNKVYFIEDVASRLNCTSLQVKKFSKTTQNLMAMNKIDTLAHTREVVDEIKQLTNMLNFQTLAIKSKEEHHTIWHNTVWGYKAPYWNQYYKVVRDYNYPFETKSDDCRVLELISDEINRLIDIQYDDVYGVNINKMEIPMPHLMQVVQHITDDKDKVKDLLEWNGYEVVGDLVVHSRMLLDNESSATYGDEWREDETFSEYDTDLKTTSMSDETSTIQELPGRRLRRALDYKVRKLRSMMTADEDITTELDKVVCRLMKLTLRTSRGRRDPPPTKWMQCKLLDLLTLTEKAVERRRQHFSKSSPMKAITYVTGEDTSSVLNKIKEDSTGLDLVTKYSHLVKQKPDLTEGEYFPMEVDDITVYSNDRDFELFDHSKIVKPTKTNLERTQAWVEEELELVKYPTHTGHVQVICATDNSGSVNKYNKCKPTKHYLTLKSNVNNITTYVNKKISNRQKNKPDDNIKYPKKVLCKKTSSYVRCSIRKNTRKRVIKEHKQLQSTISKPIPGSLIELCTPDTHVIKTIEKPIALSLDVTRKQEEIVVAQMTENGINNEESYLGDIVMDGDGETSLLHGVSHHTTGTDVETDKKQTQKDTILGNVMNAFHECSQEDRKSETIFLYDINEPSTSKGLRHVCMDAQCGPDDNAECLAPSPSPLDLKTASIDNKSKHSLNNMLVDSKKSNVGSTFNVNENNNSSISTRTTSIGIKIKDSDTQMQNKKDTTITQQETVADNDLKANAVDVGSIILTPQSDEQLQVLHTTVKQISKEGDKEFEPAGPTDIDIVGIVISRLKLCSYDFHLQNCNDTHEEDVAKQEKLKKQKRKLDNSKTSKEPIKSSTPTLELTDNAVNKKEVSMNHNKMPQIANEQSVLKSKLPIKVKMQRESQKAINQGVSKKPQIRNSKLTIIKKRSGTKINESSKGPKIHKVTLKKVKSSVLTKNAEEIVKSLNMSAAGPLCSTKKNPKSYLPLYLRKKLGTVECIDKEKAKLESKTAVCKINVEETKDIQNVVQLPAKHLSEFLVYRNETRKPTKDEEPSDRSNSPASVASSTCSSPSVVTIKVHPCSNPKLNNDTDSKSATSIKSKKTARNRTGKINKGDKDDKENDPSILCSENTYITSNPTVFMTKLSNTPLHSTENTSTKQRKPIIPEVESAVDRQSSVEIIKKKSTKINSKETEKMENIDNVGKNDALSDIQNDLYDAKTGWEEFSSDRPRTSTPVLEIDSNDLNNRLLSDLLELNDESSSNNYKPIYMTDLIVDMLNVIDTTTETPLDLDSGTVVLDQGNLRDENFEDENISIESAKTVVDTLLNITDCDEQGDISCETVVADNISEDLTFTGIEVLSLPTGTTSEVSNLQNVEDEIVDELQSHNSDSNHDSYHSASRGSVLDLFERKEILPCPANIGPLATQAFSGFSVNNDPAVGDQQTDYISLFDSETGSPAMGVSRQAESEEMFISGRSSVTYASCSVDEDAAAVPDWLFRIINQPLHVQDADLDAITIPLPEPHYDDNGNVVDPLVGTDAGAGDGRGVHSDVSQDSSGQGSSLSSSDASSGPLSEAVLINPSMLNSQFGIPPPIPLSFDSAESSPMDLTVHVEAGESVDVPARSPREVHRDPGGPLLGASDADADESSLDTDAE